MENSSLVRSTTRTAVSVSVIPSKLMVYTGREVQWVFMCLAQLCLSPFSL
uniref:Uncharacterized protein n=1 Tax=Picea sitchensis TaxID=3332 RepID=A0A6B9XXF7_PICSI|nr:hypothetical protein Q903MT_gene6878 [Picea sitchensis]